jgi:4a-hydroxytetrahydrobiopterin dehydratase
MTELLSQDQIAEALTRLPQWRHDGDALLRTAELADFPQAIAVVNRIAEIAEQDNHHPDIDIRWRTLTFRCATHSAGGITPLDVALAEQIDHTLDVFADQR